MDNKFFIKGEIEKDLTQKNFSLAGVDEVGRGCLAGPVVAASVSLDYKKLEALDDKTKGLIRDSKKLSHNQRSKIIPIIEEIAISYAIGEASVREIETKGILPATFLAMHRAIAGLDMPKDMLLVDGNNQLPNYKGQQKTVVKGDSLCYSIAAASIIAKEFRDSYMTKQAEKYPGYGFESHVGYGTKKHMEALKEIGITEIHRKNFAPVTRLIKH